MVCYYIMFEMLGNFLIGDYFKNEVIYWVWEFLIGVEWFVFDLEKLYVIVYLKDIEVKCIWCDEVGLFEDYIIDVEDNFWDIGVGLSGLDMEIFYDCGEEFLDILEDDLENYFGGENECYLEIWNLVFFEFNYILEDMYELLLYKNIDMGMGLECVVFII